MKSYLQLNLSLLYWTLVAPFTGQLFKIGPVFRQMVFIGVRAAPMVALTAFSVGVTLAMQAAHSLQSLGAQMYIPDLVIVTLLRELGPVLIAVIVIGRSGSAVAAELGTMKVSEEIEALEVMAINPVQYLVVPRFLAMMVMLPALTIFGNYIGIFGGWAVREEVRRREGERARDEVMIALRIAGAKVRTAQEHVREIGSH